MRMEAAAFAEDLDGRIDLDRIQFGKRLMDQAIALKAGGEFGEIDILFGLMRMCSALRLSMVTKWPLFGGC